MTMRWSAAHSQVREIAARDIDHQRIDFEEGPALACLPVAGEHLPLLFDEPAHLVPVLFRIVEKERKRTGFLENPKDRELRNSIGSNNQISRAGPCCRSPERPMVPGYGQSVWHLAANSLFDLKVDCCRNTSIPGVVANHLASEHSRGHPLSLRD
jgi:hypothetical protein